MTEQAQEDWFNTNPTKPELKQNNDAMLEYFAHNHIAPKKPEDLSGIINGILNVLETKQPNWTKATRTDLTTQKKRYLSLYDMVRNAYSNIPITKKKVEQWQQDQDAKNKKAKDNVAE